MTTFTDKRPVFVELPPSRDDYLFADGTRNVHAYTRAVTAHYAGVKFDDRPVRSDYPGLEGLAAYARAMATWYRKAEAA